MSRGKKTLNFLMVVKFGASWGLPKNFSKSYYYGDFLKNGLKSNFLEKLYRDFPVKNEENFLMEIFT